MLHLRSGILAEAINSRPELFCKKGFPKPATLLKKRPWHKCFPGNFAKFLRILFFTEHI